MRILQLTPGTGSFLCGSCLRDNALTLALRARGHDALIVPLYLPFALEDDDPSPAKDAPVRMGGINVWLHQRLPFLKHLPRVLTKRLDAPGLLRFVARHANMTDASGHGPMTLSMLRGEAGRQREELEQLVGWMKTMERPDVVILSNAMLVGLAHEIERELGCPVLTTLQGEAPFLDALPEPWRASCWDELGRRARNLSGHVAVSHYTAELMSTRLGLAPDRVHVVWNGIDPRDFEPDDAVRAAAPPTVGYLARMCRDKGLETLFEAFVEVKRRVPEARLDAAGVVLGDDRRLVSELERRARRAGFGADVSFRADVSRAEKIRLLQRATVFSVPATYGESFGLYLLEALACGTPVVEPRHGGLPEVVEASGGGLVCEPDDPSSLAEGLVELLLDRERACTLGRKGRDAVHARFTAARMAEGVETVCRTLLART